MNRSTLANNPLEPVLTIGKGTFIMLGESIMDEQV